MGDRPPGCAWWAFHDPEVAEVLRASDWEGELREYWGDDPVWRLVEGLGHYKRARGLARADAHATIKARRDQGGRRPPPKPRGSVTKGITRG